MTTALLLIGGTGSRFGSPTPKQFHLLCGKKIYLWTLENLKRSKLFDEIIVVCPEHWVESVSREVDVRVIAGGTTRQESSHLGLLACHPKTEIVLIHDGVRPFVSKKILEENILAAKDHGAADTCIPSNDTLVYSKGGRWIEGTPNRVEYLRGQTPQTFSYPLILEAHKKYGDTPVTDDCQLVHAMGRQVAIVEGSENNMKITTERDLAIAEMYIASAGV